jgi:hypothetical protein
VAITDLNPGDEIVDTWVDAVQSNVGDAWIDWSANFTITANVTNPTKGNSTYSARYRQVNDHTILYTVRISIGSTFSAGSGIYSFAVPVASADSGMYGAAGAAWINDSGTTLRVGTVLAASASTLQIIIPKGTLTNGGEASNVTSSVPQTWATNDSINFTLAYEV